MNGYHDPTRQESYLHQCLAHDKKPIGIFIGAGAPMAIKNVIDGSTCPLIPDIAEMTRNICTILSADTDLKDFFTIILSHFESEGKPNPNIEEILSHIRSLKQIVGAGEVRGLNLLNLTSLEGSICNKINDIVNKSLCSKNTPYHKIAAWVRAISRTRPVEIFTTNYDLLMEQSLEDLRIPYFDGFSGSRFTFFDPHTIEDDQLPSDWARLWKLHGSINWYVNDSGLVYRSIHPSKDEHRQVIHPSHLKYDESRKMPYLAMIDRLKMFIKNPSALLLTCGYSYRDMHLNDIIYQGLQSNPTAIAFGLLYGDLGDYPDAVKLSQNCPNLNLLAHNDAMIGMKDLPWMEKSSDSGDIENSTAIEWIKDSMHNVSKANFKLGDFGSLGNFFEDIIGSKRKGENLNV